MIESFNWFYSLKSSDYLALASVVVAFAALALTFWQGKQNFNHNKLIVRPYLCTMEHNSLSGHMLDIKFELINCGIGPAIIKNFVLLYDDVEVSRNNLKTYEDFIREKFSDCNDLQWSAYVPGTAMQINEKIELVSFKCDAGKDISVTKKLNILVDYQSIYLDEIRTYDSRKDRKFHGV